MAQYQTLGDVYADGIDGIMKMALEAADRVLTRMVNDGGILEVASATVRGAGNAVDAISSNIPTAGGTLESPPGKQSLPNTVSRQHDIGMEEASQRPTGLPPLNDRAMTQLDAIRESGVTITMDGAYLDQTATRSMVGPAIGTAAAMARNDLSCPN
jgi:hypothetical protein